MSRDSFREFAEQAEWIFAKTMPGAPHWYTLRRSNDEDQFGRAVTFIRAHGYQRRYEGRDYTTYDLDEWYYWTMGAPLGETILINRARLSSSADERR